MSIKIQRCFKGLYSPQQPSMAYKVSATTHPSLTICFLPLPTLLPSLHPFSLYHTIFLHPSPGGTGVARFGDPRHPRGGSRSLQWSETGMEDTLPSDLSIYARIFLCVFIVYRRIVRILCLLLYSAIC